MKQRRRGVLGGIVIALAVLAACSDSDGHSMDEAGSATEEFRAGMHALWEDHITWTRLVIVSAAADLPDLQPALDRLLLNQEHIGEAIKPFYGEAAGIELTRLLKDHIAVAGDILVAAKTGNSAAQQAALSSWYTNADEIGGFLSQANPEEWPATEMKKMMKDHLDLTLEEATARLTGDWAGDVVAYDKVVVEIRQMADMLADGIVAQFPKRFA